MLPTIGRPSFVAFVTRVREGVIDAYDTDANRLTGTSLELGSLIYQIIFHAVDLLNHRFGEDFHFHTDFDGCELSARYDESGVFDRHYSRNDLAKRSVTTPSAYTATLIARVHNTLMGSDPCYKSRRLCERVQVFIEMHGDEVAETGIAMQIARTFEGLAERI